VIECPACGGTGCPSCDQGDFEIDRCPLEVITPDIWEAIEMAGFYKKALPPVAGGVLDQANIFIAACTMIWNEEKYYKVPNGLLS
jgi:hypothetical protein